MNLSKLPRLFIPLVILLVFLAHPPTAAAQGGPGAHGPSARGEGECAPPHVSAGWGHGEGHGASGWSDWTRLFIYPGFTFRAVDALITNFHLPRSTLLMLVGAFAGRALVQHAYQEAIRQRYRFFSFGDACLFL